MYNDSKFFFTLIAVAFQFHERALYYEKLGEEEWKADSYKKYNAALLLIAELYTCTDVSLAERLVEEYDISINTKYIGVGFLVTEDEVVGEEDEDDDD